MRNLLRKVNKEAAYNAGQHFGFVEVRPLYNTTGEEQFGVVELASNYVPVPDLKATNTSRSKTLPLLTAGLRLSGTALNLWLSDDRHERELWQGLGQALPATPVQFMLRRRQGSLEQHYSGWQNAVSERLPDPAVRFAFLEDYLENFVYPTEDAQPVELWAGLLVSGQGEAEVSERLAALFVALSELGYEVAPLTAAELSNLLLDYYNPDFASQSLDELGEYELPLVEPAFGETAIFAGLAQSFWKVAAPPSPREGGWVRALLERTSRAVEFDLVTHLTPTTAEVPMREVLERRLTALEATMQQAYSSGDGVLYHDLEAKQLDLLERLARFESGSERFFEVGLTLSLRSATEDFEQLNAEISQSLREVGVALNLVAGAANVERAWHTCAPLNLNRLPRSFVVPTIEAGRLAQLLATPTFSGNAGLSEAVAAPLLGLNRAGEPVMFEPAAQVGQTALFFTGNPGAASVRPSRNLVKYLAAMRFLRGERLLGFDPSGDWRRLVQQLGGVYVGLGPNNASIWHYNPLQFIGLPQGSDSLETVQDWSEQTAAFMSTVLNLSPVVQVDDEQLADQLRTVLVQLAFSNCTNLDEDVEALTASRLYAAAVAGGYTELAQQLARCTGDGDLAWLFERPTKLAPILLGNDLDMLFVGFTGQAEMVLSEAARAAILAKAFAYFVNIPPRPDALPRLLIFDDAEALLLELEAATSLTRLIKGETARRKALSLWCISQTPLEWLARQVGQLGLEQASAVLLFNQSGPGLVGAAKRLGLSSRAQRAVREVKAGGALIVERTTTGARKLEMFGPVAPNYIARLSQAPVSKALPAPEAASRVPAGQPNVPPRSKSESTLTPVIVMPAVSAFEKSKEAVPAINSENNSQTASVADRSLRKRA